MKEIEAIVLAGGYGLRLDQSGRQETQKCLLPIEGRPILGQIMESLVLAFGSVDLKIGIGHKGQDVVDYVDVNKPKNITVTYIPHIPGTEGWGIYKDMENYIEGNFVALPGDILALPSVYEDVMREFLDNHVDAAITLSPNIEDADTHGVGRIEKGSVVDLIWPPPEVIKENYLRDMTIWASDKNFFDVIKHYPNPGKGIGYLFMDAVRDTRSIAGSRYDLPWLHLGYRRDLERKLQQEQLDLKV